MMSLSHDPSPIGIVITDKTIDVLILPFKSPNSDQVYFNAVHFGPFELFKRWNLDVYKGLISLVLCLGNPNFTITRSIPYVDILPSKSDIIFTTNKLIYEERMKSLSLKVLQLTEELKQERKRWKEQEGREKRKRKRYLSI